MRKHFQLILLVSCLFASNLPLVAAYLPPIPQNTREARLEPIGQMRSQANLHYISDDIAVAGRASADAQKSTFSFTGSYITRQPLEEGVSLAFQIYSKEGELLLLDGNRTPFTKTEDGWSAEYNYNYTLADLKLPLQDKQFYIKFNYIKEGVYWADIKFPEIELPAFHITDLSLGEQFSIRFSYFPIFIPKDQKSYSLIYYTSKKNEQTPFFHRASVQVFYEKNAVLDDNRRYDIPNTGSTTTEKHKLISEYHLEDTGRVKLRLGFVWDGVQWYSLPESDYQTAWVLNTHTYLAIALGSLVGVFLLFHFGRKSRRRAVKMGLYSAGILALLLYCLEFCGVYLPILILSAIALLLALLNTPSNYRSYWILLTYLALNETIWTVLIPTGPSELSANVFSVALGALLLAPSVLIKKRKIRIPLVNATAIAIASFYLTLSLYYLFFVDYPTFNVLTYASQGANLVDSIQSLIDHRFTSFGYCSILFLVSLNISEFRIPLAERSE